MNTPPEYVTRADGTRLAVRRTSQPKAKSGPTLVFLPGYMSDMQGSKAVALEAWAIRHNRAMVRFDYAGCGESEGRFTDYTLKDWLADTLLILDLVVRGPAILVGSSMGGWLMLLAALARPSDVKGLIGIAAAPDFTRWGFSADEKMRLHRDGQLAEETPYGPDPYITTLNFWRSGEGKLLLEDAGGIAITCPVRLIQGQADPDVPWDIALKTAAALHSADVQVQLIKDGDHRLSRDADIAQICDVATRLYQTIGS